MAKPILVVDDSPSIRHQVVFALRGAGFETIEATDGIDGLTKLDGAAIVICDIYMPRMSGLEMLEEMQKQGRHVGVKSLILTTEAEPRLMARARRAGAKGWIIKPIKSDVIVAAVKKLLLA